MLLYNKRKKITININTYQYIPKQIKIWNVTVQPRLWESYGTLGIDKKYLWRWCFCVNIDLQVHLQSLTACHHSSHSPYNFYNRCCHFLQQKLHGNNYYPNSKHQPSSCNHKSHHRQNCEFAIQWVLPQSFSFSFRLIYQVMDQIIKATCKQAIELMFFPSTLCWPIRYGITTPPIHK